MVSPGASHRPKVNDPGSNGFEGAAPLVDLVFSVFARYPRDRRSFVEDTLHTVRELGLVYNSPAQRGKYLFQSQPGAETSIVEEKEGGDPRGAKFARAVETVRGTYWPNVWMAVEIPREDPRTGQRASTWVPVVVALRELARSGAADAYRGSEYCEITVSLSAATLMDVEREDDSEQGLHWFANQVFVPLLISREAVFGKADFDPSAAREVTLRHLEKLQVPDFFLLNYLGPEYVRTYGVEPFLNRVINPLELQRKWMLRTPEGALLFRAKVEADRWNGRQEPPVDFHEWEGRFQILRGLRGTGNPKARPAHS